jgi:hypothetical protein
MSFVFLRPDLAEFTNVLEGKDRNILKVNASIIGPASL